MDWLHKLLNNAMSHPGGMAYSPAQSILFGIIGLILSTYLIVSALRTGIVPRARPRWGSLPPEMEKGIQREKQPGAFWRNVWCGIFIAAVSAGCLIGGISMLFARL
jgi:hypothetical protein